VRFFTTLKLGPNRDKTPEGFLLCRNVPIGRTGVQLYGPGETPVADGADGTVRIHRRPEDVFRDETIDSFNGKPVTVDHPDVDVTPDNWKDLAVGVVLDARRGVGVEDDLLMADLLITDKEAIRMVLDEGLDEISSGYDAEYEEEAAGVGYQVDILGNHVALVDQGRCGPRCSIRDAEGEMKVATKAKPTFKDRIRNAFKAKDQDELEQVLEAIEEASSDGNLVGETHIHIHADGENGENGNGENGNGNGNGNGDADPAEAARAIAAAREGQREESTGDQEGEEGTDLAERLAACERTVAEITARLAALEGTGDSKGAVVAKTGDQDPDEDVTEETSDSAKGDAAKTTDSRYMEESIQSTMAAAEILAPGISFPTFDRATKPRDTVTSITSLRKKALSIAASTTAGATMLAELRGDRPLTQDALAKLSVKDTRSLFFSAAAQMKAQNRSATQFEGFARTADAPGPMTIKQMNEMNRAFWEKRVN
jgi:hypothetical protein